MNACPKLNPVRDRKYLDWLRDQPCVLTGWRATEQSAVDPIHVGTLGKGIKASDDEALPVWHALHKAGHDHGEMSMFRKHMPDYLLRDCLRAYAREQYRAYVAQATEDHQGSAAGASGASPEVAKAIRPSTSTLAEQQP